MVGVVLSVDFHIRGQAVDVVGVLIGIVSFKRGKLFFREKNILILTVSAAYLSFFCLNHIFIFLFSITWGQILPHTR